MHRFEIDVAPGQIAINARDKFRAFMAGSRPVAQRYASPKWKKAVEEVVQQMAFEWGSKEPIDGPVRVEVLTRFPRCKRKGPDAGLAYGDVDATSKAALDALAKAGVIHDDGQVVECLLRKEHGEPGLVVSAEMIERENGGQDFPASTTGRPT